MRKSSEKIQQKKRRVSKGTFFDGTNLQSTAVLTNRMEMGYSLTDFSTNIRMGHLQLGIATVKTPLMYCIECFIACTTQYEQRCCLLSKQTQGLIIAKMKSVDFIQSYPVHIAAAEELVILVQHAFWLALILPSNERHAVVVNLISHINFGKPAEGTAPGYSLQTFISDCKTVLDQERFKYFFACLQTYSNTLTAYEKITFDINKLSQELLQIDSMSNFYFIKHYSFLLSAIPSEELRQDALQYLFENYSHDIQNAPIVDL